MSQEQARLALHRARAQCLRVRGGRCKAEAEAAEDEAKATLTSHDETIYKNIIVESKDCKGW